MWEGDYFLADAYIDPAKERRAWVMDDVETAKVSEFTAYHAVGDFTPLTLQGKTLANCRCLQHQHAETESPVTHACHAVTQM